MVSPDINNADKLDIHPNTCRRVHTDTQTQKSLHVSHLNISAAAPGDPLMTDSQQAR